MDSGYTILWQSDVHALAGQVHRHLRDGWVPVGGATLVKRWFRRSLWTQTMYHK